MGIRALLILAITLAAGLPFGPAAMGDVPQLIPYQGTLRDASGTPVTTIGGPGVPIVIAIYDAALGGTELYREEHASVLVANGIYNLSIGGGTPQLGMFGPSLFDATSRWLELRVGGETLSPRQALRSVPYSLTTEDADTLEGLTAAQVIAASEGPPGNPGAQGPAGPAGPAGPSVSTFVVCALGQGPLAGCRSCSGGVQLSRVREPCAVTSDTGSCSLTSAAVGECCVCRP